MAEIIKIHPEILTPPRSGPMRHIDLLQFENRFYNPYQTRAEFDEKLEKFMELQRDFLKRVLVPHSFGEVSQMLARTDLDSIVSFINQNVSGLTSDHISDYFVLDKIMDKRWRTESLVSMIPFDPDFDKNRFLEKDVRKASRRFSWDTIFTTHEINYRKQRFLIRKLYKDNFTERELIEAGRKAINIADTLRFSTHLYGINYAVHNPLERTLDNALDICGRLAAARIPENELPAEIRKCAVVGYFPTHNKGQTYVAVECSLTDEEKSEWGTPAIQLKLYNADKSLFPDILQEGDLVWCIKDRYHDNSGRLVSVGL